MIEDIDYLISAVSYKPSDNKVKKVLAHKRKDKYGVGYPYEETRAQLLKKMERGKTYYTLVKGQNTPYDYDVGDQVKRIEVDSETFLRTDDKEEKADFLAGTEILEEPY